MDRKPLLQITSAEKLPPPKPNQKKMKRGYQNSAAHSHPLWEELTQGPRVLQTQTYIPSNPTYTYSQPPSNESGFYNPSQYRDYKDEGFHAPAGSEFSSPTMDSISSPYSGGSNPHILSRPISHRQHLQPYTPSLASPPISKSPSISHYFPAIARENRSINPPLTAISSFKASPNALPHSTREKEVGTLDDIDDVLFTQPYYPPNKSKNTVLGQQQRPLRHSAAKTNANANVNTNDTDDDFSLMFSSQFAGSETNALHQPFSPSRPAPPQNQPPSRFIPPAPLAEQFGFDGTSLVPVSRLLSEHRRLFPQFTHFNSVQSVCFDTVYNTDKNLVVAAPTGCGKTTVFELAILRLFRTGAGRGKTSHSGSNSSRGRAKVKAVYICPLRALCQEKTTEWSGRFQPLGLRVTQLTSETQDLEYSQLDASDIIVTTPEKWDTMTRRWNSSSSSSALLDSIALFMIDEVHILGEKRGGALEGTITRCKIIRESHTQNYFTYILDALASNGFSPEDLQKCQEQYSAQVAHAEEATNSTRTSTASVSYPPQGLVQDDPLIIGKSINVFDFTSSAMEAEERINTFFNQCMSLELFSFSGKSLTPQALSQACARARARLPPIAEMRLIALSATVPNFGDITEWLNARGYSFGGNYRPVPLDVLVKDYPPHKNVFLFNNSLNYKLYDLIRDHSTGRPTLVFNATRSECTKAAQEIVKQATLSGRNVLFSSNEQRRRLQIAARSMKQRSIADVVAQGVGVHSAGLEPAERGVIERLFLQGDLMVLCTTSTLAQGVNLPAHLVIIKGTQCYEKGSGYVEYPSSSIIQMMGRAGRPQFDTSAKAIILTSNDSRHLYFNMQQLPVESNLKASMIEHINAEVVLGTMNSDKTAHEWISNTYLFVCTKRQQRIGSDKNKSKALIDFVMSELKRLEDAKMLERAPNGAFGSTKLGRMLARYYLRFDTGLLLSQLSPNASVESIIDMCSKSEDLAEVQIKMGEKTLLHKLNRITRKDAEAGVLGGVRFPVRKITLNSDKVKILFQVALTPGLKTPNFELNMDMDSIIQISSRVISAAIEYLPERLEYACLRSALLIRKALSQRMWAEPPPGAEDFTFEQVGHFLMQLDGIGEKYCQTLVGKGINSFERLLDTRPHLIDTYLGRNPGFGQKLHDILRNIPVYSLSHTFAGSAGYGAGFRMTVTVSQSAQTVDVSKSKSTAHLLIGDEDNRLLAHHIIRVSSLVNPLTFNVNVPIGHKISIEIIDRQFVGIDVKHTAQVPGKKVPKSKNVNLGGNTDIVKPPERKVLIDTRNKEDGEDSSYDEMSDAESAKSPSNNTTSPTIGANQADSSTLTTKDRHKQKSETQKKNQSYSLTSEEKNDAVDELDFPPSLPPLPTFSHSTFPDFSSAFPNALRPQSLPLTDLGNNNLNTEVLPTPTVITGKLHKSHDEDLSGNTSGHSLNQFTPMPLVSKPPQVKVAVSVPTTARGVQNLYKRPGLYSRPVRLEVDRATQFDGTKFEVKPPTSKPPVNLYKKPVSTVACSSENESQPIRGNPQPQPQLQMPPRLNSASSTRDNRRYSDDDNNDDAHSTNDHFNDSISTISSRTRVSSVSTHSRASGKSSVKGGYSSSHFDNQAKKVDNITFYSSAKQTDGPLKNYVRKDLGSSDMQTAFDEVPSISESHPSTQHGSHEAGENESDSENSSRIMKDVSSFLDGFKLRKPSRICDTGETENRAKVVASIAPTVDAFESSKTELGSKDGLHDLDAYKLRPTTKRNVPLEEQTPSKRPKQDILGNPALTPPLRPQANVYSAQYSPHSSRTQSPPKLRGYVPTHQPPPNPAKATKFDNCKNVEDDDIFAPVPEHITAQINEVKKQMQQESHDSSLFEGKVTPQSSSGLEKIPGLTSKGMDYLRFISSKIPTPQVKRLYGSHRANRSAENNWASSVPSDLTQDSMERSKNRSNNLNGELHESHSVSAVKPQYQVRPKPTFFNQRHSSMGRIVPPQFSRSISPQPTVGLAPGHFLSSAQDFGSNGTPMLSSSSSHFFHPPISPQAFEDNTDFSNNLSLEYSHKSHQNISAVAGSTQSVPNTMKNNSSDNEGEFLPTKHCQTFPGTLSHSDENRYSSDYFDDESMQLYPPRTQFTTLVPQRDSSMADPREALGSSVEVPSAPTIYSPSNSAAIRVMPTLSRQRSGDSHYSHSIGVSSSSRGTASSKSSLLSYLDAISHQSATRDRTFSRETESRHISAKHSMESRPLSFRERDLSHPSRLSSHFSLPSQRTPYNTRPPCDGEPSGIMGVLPSSLSKTSTYSQTVPHLGNYGENNTACLPPNIREDSYRSRTDSLRGQNQPNMALEKLELLRQAQRTQAYSHVHDQGSMSQSRIHEKTPSQFSFSRFNDNYPLVPNTAQQSVPLPQTTPKLNTRSNFVFDLDFE